MERIKIDLNYWEGAVCPIKTDNVDLAQAEKDLYIRMRCICGYDDNDITKYLNNNNEEELSAEEYNNRERFMSCLCEQEEKAVLGNGGVYYEDIEGFV